MWCMHNKIELWIWILFYNPPPLFFIIYKTDLIFINQIPFFFSCKTYLIFNQPNPLFIYFFNPLQNRSDFY